MTDQRSPIKPFETFAARPATNILPETRAELCWKILEAKTVFLNPAAEKYEIIRLMKESNLPIRKTRERLEDRKSKPPAVWNRKSCPQANRTC